MTLSFNSVVCHFLQRLLYRRLSLLPFFSCHSLLSTWWSPLAILRLFSLGSLICPSFQIPISTQPLILWSSAFNYTAMNYLTLPGMCLWLVTYSLNLAQIHYHSLFSVFFCLCFYSLYMTFLYWEILLFSGICLILVLSNCPLHALLYFAQGNLE